MRLPRIFPFLAVWPGLAAGGAAATEGRVVFANRFLAAGVNAPVQFLGDLRPGSPLGGEVLSCGPMFMAQLAAWTPDGGAKLVGEPAPFRCGNLAGSIAPHEVLVPTVDGQPGGLAEVAMLAWVAELGASFAEALSQGIGGVGMSHWIQIGTGNPRSGAPPAPLVGLRRFSIDGFRGEPFPPFLAALQAARRRLHRDLPHFQTTQAAIEATADFQAWLPVATNQPSSWRSRHEVTFPWPHAAGFFRAREVRP